VQRHPSQTASNWPIDVAKASLENQLVLTLVKEKQVVQLWPCRGNRYSFRFKDEWEVLPDIVEK
jgi:hypothetical protein